MLMSMRAHIEAGRALAYSCALAVDLAKYGEGDQQAHAASRVDLLTPIVKGWLTETSNEVTSLGVQIFGGMGYIEETGAAQHMRDARILAIYEGTNGIQANDLVFRKMARDQGAALRVLTDEVGAFLASLSSPDFSSPSFVSMRKQLTDALVAMTTSSAWLLDKAKSNPAVAAASASPFLRLCGNLLGGFYLIRSAALAQQDLTAKIGDSEFLSAKIVTASFFATHILPHCLALAATVREGAAPTLDMPDLFI
jgi:hypothetical protein